MSDLRAVNARLRQVVADKDELIAVHEQLLAAERERSQIQDALVSGQAAQIAKQDEILRVQAAQIETQAELIKRLSDEVAELKRRLDTDSTNSSSPPSKDSIAAKARQKTARQVSQRQRSADRKPGGQSGHTGSGLTPTQDPDRSERAAEPQQCGSCGNGLSDVDDVSGTWTQIWDLPPVKLRKTHWVLPRRRCRCCRKTNTAVVPSGQAGAVVYGPNVNAAAVLLASQGNVPVERTAAVMAALLGAPVSAGFVAAALARFAARLHTAGFDEAMKAALAAEDVLCGDESPVNVLRKDTDPATGTPVKGSPHVVTLRTPDGRLVWLAGIPARSKTALRQLGVFDRFTGWLVRDDYAGWHQFDTGLAGVQQCVQHLLRHLQGVLDLHPQWQAWAGQVQTVLRDADQAVTQALADGHDSLDPQQLADLRERYDKATHWGMITNRHRDWPDGNHPGYTLAKRLRDKTDQVWAFTTNFKIPWTNNASEQTLKDPKRHQAVSGYWHTMATLSDYCRIRSYLTSARNHGMAAIDAIHTALLGRPWLPAPITG